MDALGITLAVLIGLAVLAGVAIFVAVAVFVLKGIKRMKRQQEEFDSKWNNNRF